MSLPAADAALAAAAAAAVPLLPPLAQRPCRALLCRWQRLRWRPTSHEEGVYYERKLLDMLRNTYEAKDVRVSSWDGWLWAIGGAFTPRPPRDDAIMPRLDISPVKSGAHWFNACLPDQPKQPQPAHTLPSARQVGPGKEDFIHTVCAGLQNTDSPAFVAIPGYSTGSSFLFKLFDG